MIFEDRFFHADLHPGNLFIHDDGTIALIASAWSAGERGAQEEHAFVALVRGISTSSARRSWASRSVANPSTESRCGGLTASSPCTTIARSARRPSAACSPSCSRSCASTGCGFPERARSSSRCSCWPRAWRCGWTPASGSARRRSCMRVASLASGSPRRPSPSARAPGRLRRARTRPARRHPGAWSTCDTTGIQVHVRAAELEPLIGRAERIGNRLVAGMMSAALINGSADWSRGNGGGARGRAP